MPSRSVFLCCLALLATVATTSGRQVGVHDPVIAREAGVYYLFSTGPGITLYSSTDLVHWRPRGRIFPGEPTWARAVAPGFNGHLWAPDIVAHAGRFYLYYSVSAFGKNTSAIGVTVNRTLDPDSPDYRWEDQGIVVRSVPGRDLWNAIDPAAFTDADGTPWLTFGSFWSGVKLVQLAPDRVSLAQPEEWHALARRERPPFTPDGQAGPAEIEAPFIFRKGDYHYLFVSWDKCCRGSASTYKMVVGRARDVRGPYLDREGRDLAAGGGTLLLDGDAEWAGVGHNSVHAFDGRDYLVCHAYETADNGRQKLKVLPLAWDEAGWPTVTREALHAYRSELLE